MTSMLDIVAEATSAATRSWKRARQAALGAGGRGHAGVEDAGVAGQLARLIETDIMPRLLAARSEGAAAASPANMPPFDTEQVRRFALGLLDDEIGPTFDATLALHAAGHDAHDLMEYLIAPAARLLGDWWLADSADFVDVTMGVWRCQQLVHALGARQPGQAPLPGNQRRVLILPAPGEQHVLGAMLVEDGFRRAGWATQGGAALDEDALIALVARESFDVIGLSVSCTTRLPGLARMLATVRRVALKPPVLLLGGPALADCQDAAALGADAIAVTAIDGVEQAERLLAARVLEPAGSR